MPRPVLFLSDLLFIFFILYLVAVTLHIYHISFLLQSHIVIHFSIIAAKRQRTWKSIVLDEQAPLDGQVSFVTVKQKNVAGFSSKVSLLYVRAETIDLWCALNKSDGEGSNLSVEGPPGTGKSTEVCGERMGKHSW